MFAEYLSFIELILFLLGICLFGIIILWSGRFLVVSISNGRFSLRRLLRDFRQKIWMTFGLGTFFISLYLLVLYLSSISANSIKNFFFLFLYRYPKESIYLGLMIFLLISIAICFIRSIIKYIYNKR